MTARIDHGTSAGTFSLDGETFEVENNIWVIGDDEECIVIDAPHNVDDVLAVVGDRRVSAILLTHSHDDHSRIAPDLAEATGAALWLHPADAPVWDLTHPNKAPDGELTDGQSFTVGGSELRAATPGHSPGAVSFYLPDLGAVFTGDTLFQGGPGATGRSFSDVDLIVESIRNVLFELPADTVVHTGHGGDTTIGAEAESLGRG